MSTDFSIKEVYSDFLEGPEELWDEEGESLGDLSELDSLLGSDPLDDFLTFEEIDGSWENFLDWSVKSKRLSYWRSCHQTIKKLWDGYKRPESMDRSETILSELRRAFPSCEGAKAGRPLGDFKDLMGEGVTQQRVYQQLLERFIIEREEGSYIDHLYGYTAEIFSKHFEKEARWLQWDEQALRDGLALMMYSSSIGIILEQKAHEELALWLEGFPKAAKIFKYEPAEASEWESKDVDGLFVYRESGEPAVKVSIKCMGALREKFIMENYRGSYGKTQPDIYAGYTDRNEDLSFIEVNGSLKQLLREAGRKL